MRTADPDVTARKCFMSSGTCHGIALSRPITPLAAWAQMRPITQTATGALMPGWCS